MATYNKRGYKAPKPKEEKAENDLIEDVIIDEKDSATAEVFNTLDETASKTEDWVARNQKAIFSVIAVLAVGAIGYMLYTKFVVEPKESDAAKEMFVAQKNFQLATDGTATDSLFNLALNGAEGKPGFLKIASDYSGTNAANLANYYAGIAYLNLGKNDEAIAHLEKFSSKDVVVKALAIGAIGDAHSNKGNQKEALDFYLKAANSDKNEFTTPRFLAKAGKVALELKNKEEALKYFTDIKENYSTSVEAQNIDALIGLAQ